MGTHSLDRIEVSGIGEGWSNRLLEQCKQRHDLYRDTQYNILAASQAFGLLTQEKALAAKQINVPTRPSFLHMGSSFKLSLSLESRERRGERRKPWQEDIDQWAETCPVAETQSIRYRCSNHRSTCWGLNTRYTMLLQADSNPRAAPESACC